MSEKKGFFATLFGGNSGNCCNMQVIPDDKRDKNSKKGGCCNMEIIEEEDNKETP